MEDWKTTHSNGSGGRSEVRGWNWMKGSNWKLWTVRQEAKKAWETERADRERRAYHLRVGGHKLRTKKKNKKKKEEEEGSKIKREEAEKKEGERRESGQRVKWITGCFNWNKKNWAKGNQKQLTWSKVTIQRKMLLLSYEWRSNVGDLYGAKIERLLSGNHSGMLKLATRGQKVC